MHIIDGRESRKPTPTRRYVSVALVVVAFAIAGGRSAWAHQDPPGCSGTGVDFRFDAFRAGGAPIGSGEVTECETITYQITIGKSFIGNPCAFEGGTMKITTPDGIVHNVTPGGGVPCIGGTGACSTTQFASLTINYTVNPADVSGGMVTATGQYNAAFSHTGVSHTLNSPNAGGFIQNVVMFCPTDTACVDNFCDPNLYDSATGALGNCDFSNIPNSTPCPDIDGSQCTFAGCDGAGNCDQNHQVTVCPPDGNPCTNDLGCDSASGACVYAPTANSTPCPDNDGSLCTTAGCDGAGHCDQNHLVNVCPPDGNPCTNDLGCDSATGACVYTPVPNSTPCPDTDNVACTTAGCEAGTCVQTHIDNCIAAVDHFECYEVKRGAFSGPHVNIVDAFGTFNNVSVQLPERLCNPADKNDEDNSAPTHEDHLVGYKVRYSSLPQPNRTITDQFGSHKLDVTKVDRLMVPAAKSLSGPPTPLTPPDVDHMTCYKVRRPKNTAPFSPVTVKVDDQFGTINITLKKPLRLCIPADKNNEVPGAESHPTGLLCYKTTKVPVSSSLTPTVLDQFGQKVVDLLRRTEFCVPSHLL